MRSIPAASWVLGGTSLLAMILVAACGPTADSDGASGEGGGSAPAEGSAMADAVTQNVPTCWLRNATVEETMDRPSPLGQTEIVLGDHVGKICYGRPSARDREVEGGLIPYDAPWRLGANEATAIHLPFAATVGGVQVGPGSYSLYVDAGPESWEFHLNSNAERWGIPIDDSVRNTDIGTFTSVPMSMADPVEQFTIGWSAADDTSGHLILEWGTTRVEFEVRLSGSTD